jgi:cyclohexa-1,5-dienecarbonyl-CoA hydratase
MLEVLHGLLRSILATDLPLVAVVRGHCLGAGLELVMLAHRIVAAPGASLGQPEISLGVFAPAASVLLLERVGRPVAEDLLLSGRSVDAAEALRVGLVDEVAAEPVDAALVWIRTHLLSKSASSLRCAVRAARVGLIERVERELPRVESVYLERLMRTRDAEEGLRAFLEKRPPGWSDA